MNAKAARRHVRMASAATRLEVSPVIVNEGSILDLMDDLVLVSI